MILNGWKEIANYLRCGLRTVQRWERNGLPVLRPAPGSRAHVVAYSENLDRWLKRSKDGLPAMESLQTEIERSQQLLLTLSQHRRQMLLRLDQLRKELAALRTKHQKH